MKKTTVTAALAAAALLLAGCGSTGGTATAGPGAATSAAVPSTHPTPVSPDLPTTSAEAPTTAESTSEEPPTTEESTSEAMPTDETTSEDAPTDETTTIGGGADGIDAQTTAWFDGYCTAMAPVVDLQNLGSEIDTSDLAGTFKALSDAMTKIGTAFNDAVANLKGAPPPTFDGGPEFADKILTAFEDLGPKFIELGEEFGKADPSDPQSMQKLASLGQDLQSAAEPMQEFANMQVSPQVQMAIMQIPSCAKMAG